VKNIDFDDIFNEEAVSDANNLIDQKMKQICNT
jgi:hypothetical protein